MEEKKKTPNYTIAFSARGVRLFTDQRSQAEARRLQGL
jgi:hypothetical protein